MKLLNCLECHDICKLPANGEWRHCMCKKSKGRYRDDWNAEVAGRARCVSIDSADYRVSLRERPDTSIRIFDWWLTRGVQHNQ